jgi:hypothetical protein
METQVPVTGIVNNILDSKLTPTNGGVSDIYVINYKDGPVLRTKHYKATSAVNALALARKYMTFLSSQDNRKVVLVGLPKPLAADLEQEMEKKPSGA